MTWPVPRSWALISIDSMLCNSALSQVLPGSRFCLATECSLLSEEISYGIVQVRRVRNFLGGGWGGGVHFKLERTSCQQSSTIYIYICIIRKVHPFLLRKETSFCVRKIRNIILSITNWKWQARWKQFRVSPAKIVSSAEGASTLRRSGPGACFPGKF